MGESLDQIIADYEREHGSQPGQMSAMDVTDADLADLQNRVYNAATQWSSDQIEQQKVIQQNEQNQDSTQIRQAVIDGLQRASEAVATGQAGSQ
jgi:hypothetical protein